MGLQLLSRNFVFSLVLVSILAALSACGFKLRGSIELSRDVAPVYIEPDGLHEQARVIRVLLEQNNIAVLTADDKNNGQYQSKIHLVSESRQRKVLSVDGNGRVSEYLLIYKLNYALTIKYMPENTYTLQVQRSLVYDPNAVLAVENQADQLYQDMQKDAARLVLLKLQALSQNRNMSSSKARTSPDDKDTANQPAASQPQATDDRASGQ
jgi:LPS-assembly lipoprotein